MHGFSSRVQAVDALTIEAWGMLKGMELCWAMGLKKVEIESDVNQLVHFMNNAYRTSP